MGSQSFLPTLPASAKITHADEHRLVWEMGEKCGVIDSDVHVIDKGVAYV